MRKNLQRLWNFLGIFLLSLALLEAMAGLLFYANVKYNLLRTSKDPHEFADGYKNSPWAHAVWTENAALEAKWQPYVYYRTKPANGTYVRINPDGLRYTLHVKAANAPQREIKIFMFGGSTLFGPGARDDYTIPSCLARILSQESNLNVNVTNFGQNGYVSTQELITFLLELRKNRPEIAIFYDGANEPYAALANGKAGLSPFEDARAKEFDMLGKNRKKELAKNFVLANIRNSTLYGLAGRLNLLPHFSRRVSAQSNVGGDELAQDVASAYQFNIKMADEISKSDGITSLFYLQPLINTKKYRTPYEEQKLKEWRQGCNCESHGSDFFLQSYDHIRASRTLSSLKNFHDISHVLDDYKIPLYTDGVHLTEFGNQIVARRIAEDVLPILSRMRPLGKIRERPDQIPNQ